jgi:hypothetical protein
MSEEEVKLLIYEIPSCSCAETISTDNNVLESIRANTQSQGIASQEIISEEPKHKNVHPLESVLDLTDIQQNTSLPNDQTFITQKHNEYYDEDEDCCEVCYKYIKQLGYCCLCCCYLLQIGVEIAKQKIS